MAKESTRQNCNSKELYWSTFNHSTQDAEASEILGVQGQPDLHRSSKTVGLHQQTLIQNKQI